MAKILILIATICFIGATYGEGELVKDFWNVRRNAQFQWKYAKVEIEKIIYEKVKIHMEKAKDDDQKNCIQDTKSLAIVDSGIILEETVGKILPDIAKVSDALRMGDAKSIEEFNKKYDYPEYKKTELANFNAKLTEMVPKLEEKLGKCIA